MGEALAAFVEEAQHIFEHFEPTTVFSIGPWDVTQYVVWLFIGFFVTLAVVLVAAKNSKLVPDNKFVNIVEFGYDFVSKNIGEDVIGSGFKQHVPFLATLFFFILVCNVLGLVPGFKTSTGTISCTWALSVISFVYFLYWGMKENGLLKYWVTLCPHGVPKPMAPIIWFLELFSTMIRVLTLAVRLYGNMLAGHMILGVFGIATSTFVLYAVMSATSAVAAVATGATSVVWFLLLVIMYALECLVAFLQAFVFAILSSSYISGAVHPH
ncbi:F0F1 ATP synthase subunit A [Slackia heliotrinireducens]|uniref:F0F1 ATP synthase subunit A n=1 Tax=Slackia heliotrinireducens TaxID=84110 RepID=UPI003314FFE4